MTVAWGVHRVAPAAGKPPVPLAQSESEEDFPSGERLRPISDRDSQALIATRRRLKVLVVGEGPPATGGIPTFVTELLSHSWLGQRVALRNVNTTRSGSRISGVPTFANFARTVMDAWAVLRSARRVDVVHLNLAPAPVLPLLRALVLSAAARAGGARVILHAHTGRLERCARSPTYRALLALTTRVVQRLVVVSRSAELVSRRYGSNVVRIENGVDVAELRTGPRADQPVMVFVGTVCPRKGLIDLLQALRVIAEGDGPARAMPVLIVGDGGQEGPEVFERVKAAYMKSGLRNVRFLGRLDRNELIDVLAGASIFCLPSHWEGFPISLLEAMGSGLAPIATNVGDVALMLDHGAAGVIVEPGDVPALGVAVSRLAADGKERERLGLAARRRVESSYSLDRTVRELYDLYADVAGYSR